MRRNTWLGVAAIAALAIAGCGDRRAASPLSPSSLSVRAPEDAPRTGGTLAPRRVDNDGDGYDDGPDPGSPTDPGTGPTPDPNQPPNPDQPPPADAPPAPVQLTINVVGSFGNGAFVPNPLHAAIGNTIVWMNNDLVPHDIVLDNGTPVGMLAPGQSSLPIALATETMGYRCTFHPTMVGQVMLAPVGAPPPPADPSQPPPAGSAPPSPPPGDPDDDGGGGYDDYYITSRQ